MSVRYAKQSWSSMQSMTYCRRHYVARFRKKVTGGKSMGSGRTLIHAHLNSHLLAVIRCARQKVRPDPVFGLTPCSAHEFGIIT